MSILGELGELGAEFLSRESRENLIRSTLPGLLAEGIGRTAAYDMYREAGIGIRKQDFLNLARDIEGEDTRSQRIRYVRDDLIPSEAVLETGRLPFTDKYRVVAEFETLDSKTGERGVSHMALDIGELYRKSDMEADILEFARASDSYPGQELTGVSIIRGYISP